MKKSTKLLIWMSIILASVNILWLGYNYYQYQNLQKWFVNLSAYEIYVHLIFYGLFVSFFSHLIIIPSIIGCLKNFSKLHSVGIGLLILGCFSFISLYFHWAGLCDILNEYPAGFEIQFELTGIFIVQIVHLAFYFFTLVYLITVLSANRIVSTQSIAGEKLFLLLNCIGVVSGIIGLMLVYLYFNVQRPLYKFEVIPYIIILLPYLLTFIYWANKSTRDKKSGWHDEKQKSDIQKSGIVALLFSIALMILFYIIKYPEIHGNASVLWLPFYVFIVLVVFSSTALYNYKIN